MKFSNLFIVLCVMSFVAAAIGKLVVLTLPHGTELRYLASIDSSLDGIAGLLWGAMAIAAERMEGDK